MAVWLAVGINPTTDEDTMIASGGADLELLLAEEELDMIEELEFYAWLDDSGELEQGSMTDGVG